MRSLPAALIILALSAGCASSQKTSTSTSAPAAPAAPAPKTASTNASPGKAAANNAAAAAPAAAAAAGAAVKCSLDGDERTLSITQPDGGCELHYAKAGNDEVKATSQNGTAVCDSVRDKIRGNLEKSGFSCQ
jgi:hypothetical protein